jgi:TIR domain
VGGRSVFISYRRQVSEHLAQRVRNYLIEHDFDVFVDLENLDSGEFDRRILREIEARMHFIVLLQPGSLDRIGEKGDWLRREIAHALARGRNVVPVTADGFEFGRDLTLPPDVARLPSFNAVDLPSGYFDAAMKKLRKRFLKTPARPAATPLPETRSVVTPDWQAQALQKSPSKAKNPFLLLVPKLTGQVVNPKLNALEFAMSRYKLVRLTWSEVSGADEYVLERAEGDANSPNQPWAFISVYRGPDRSYDDKVYEFGSAVSAVHYRVHASGRLPTWSNTLKLRVDFRKWT